MYMLGVDCSKVFPLPKLPPLWPPHEMKQHMKLNVFMGNGNDNIGPSANVIANNMKSTH